MTILDDPLEDLKGQFIKNSFQRKCYMKILIFIPNKLIFSEDMLISILAIVEKYKLVRGRPELSSFTSTNKGFVTF